MLEHLEAIAGAGGKNLVRQLAVEAPDGTAARPFAPQARTTSTSMVGFPRESSISLAMTSINSVILPPLPNILFIKIY